MKPTREEAIQIQKEYRNQIDLSPLQKSIDLVAGADISFNRGSDKVYAGFVILSLPTLKEVARSLVISETTFPYIPGLLAFREMPPLLEAWEQLKLKPNVTILDGHGIAHPRRMGIATHFGIEVDHPTIGCAKSVLTGDFQEPDLTKGSYSWLLDDGEKIGMALRSRTKVNPVFISPGYKVSFEDAYEITMQCLGKYKLPKTTRAAHQRVNELRRGEIKPGYVEWNADQAD